MPKIFGLCLPITRRDQKRIDTDLFQRLWQRSGDVAEAAGFRIWNGFRRNDRDTHCLCKYGRCYATILTAAVRRSHFVDGKTFRPYALSKNTERGDEVVEL